jgi:hypothetical protein
MATELPQELPPQRTSALNGISMSIASFFLPDAEHISASSVLGWCHSASVIDVIPRP